MPHSANWGGDIDLKEPFTGNGFTASKERIMPEWYFAHGVEIKTGAEIWRLNADGSSQLAGVLTLDSNGKPKWEPR